MWPARRGRMEQHNGMLLWRRANGHHSCRRKLRGWLWRLMILVLGERMDFGDLSGIHLAIQEFISTVQKATHESCFKLRYMTLYID